MGTHYYAALEGDPAEDADALAAALHAEWPTMTITPLAGDELMAYGLELDGELGSLHADGTCISFKRAEKLVIRLAIWWRERLPPDARLVVFDDSTATPLEVEPGARVADLLGWLG